MNEQPQQTNKVFKTKSSSSSKGGVTQQKEGIPFEDCRSLRRVCYTISATKQIHQDDRVVINASLVE